MKNRACGTSPYNAKEKVEHQGVNNGVDSGAARSERGGQTEDTGPGARHVKRLRENLCHWLGKGSVVNLAASHRENKESVGCGHCRVSLDPNPMPRPELGGRAATVRQSVGEPSLRFSPENRPLCTVNSSALWQRSLPMIERASPPLGFWSRHADTPMPIKTHLIFAR